MENNSAKAMCIPTRALVLGASSLRTPGDARCAQRYPIALNARYQALKRGTNDGGAGTTVNISSCGFLITSEHSVTVGAKLEVAVDWPALLDGAVDLLLVATGQVVRARELSFAVAFSRYEFRTTKRKLKAGQDGAVLLRGGKRLADPNGPFFEIRDWL